MNLLKLLTRLAALTLTLSCGLPDTLLILESPSVSSLTNTDTISGQYFGSDLSQYGVIIFYKTYTESNSSVLFDQDLNSWASRVTEDQIQVSNSLKFKYITLTDRAITSKDVLPIVVLNKSGDWQMEFEAFPNLSSEPILRLTRNGGSNITPTDRVVQRYSLEPFNLASGFTFSGATDPDLIGISNGSGFIYVGFVIEAYGFSPLSGNVYSKPVKLRIVQVQ